MTQQNGNFFNDWKDADGSSLDDQEREMLSNKIAVLHNKADKSCVKIFVQFEDGRKKSKIENLGQGKEPHFIKLCTKLEESGFIVPFKPKLSKASPSNPKD